MRNAAPRSELGKLALVQAAAGSVSHVDLLQEQGYVIFERLAALLLKSAACRALLLHEPMLSIMEQVLGPHCDRYQLNLSQAVRLGWLKQYENAFLTYPPAIAAQFPKPIRDLLGYRIHRPNLGGYEGQDPSVLFQTDSHALPAMDCVCEANALQLEAFYRNVGSASAD